MNKISKIDSTKKQILEAQEELTRVWPLIKVHMDSKVDLQELINHPVIENGIVKFKVKHAFETPKKISVYSLEVNFEDK